MIASIGDLEQLTAITEQMKMTQGGICKNIKKLVEENLITHYRKDDNAKNIYYRLTEAGLRVYEKHTEAHEAWLTRDRAFMEGFSAEQLAQAADFMKEFIKHINERISDVILK